MNFLPTLKQVVEASVKGCMFWIYLNWNCQYLHTQVIYNVSDCCRLWAESTYVFCVQPMKFRTEIKCLGVVFMYYLFLCIFKLLNVTYVYLHKLYIFLVIIISWIKILVVSLGHPMPLPSGKAMMLVRSDLIVHYGGIYKWTVWIDPVSSSGNVICWFLR